MRSQTKYKELAAKAYCPCDSGKWYGKCCKGKDFKWERNREGDIRRVLNVPSEVMEQLREYKQKFERVFGREMNDNEQVFSSISVKDNIHEFIRIGKIANLPEKYLYAIYKTGIAVTDFNKDQFPDKDLADWTMAVEEFEQLTSNINIMDGKINNVAFYVVVHQLLEAAIKRIFEELNIGIAKFLSDYNPHYIEWDNFSVVDKKTYIEYCLFKTLKNIEAADLLIEHAHTENAYATVRFIFETYINIYVFTRNDNLYNQKLRPLIGLELGTFEEVIGNHGKPLKNKFRELATGTIFKTETPIKFLAETAATNNPAVFDIYKILYDDLSGYVHVNVTLAKNYFSSNEPYGELDENLFAGFLSIIFSYLHLYEIAKLEYVPSQLKRDLNFLAEKISDEILSILHLLKADEDKPLYGHLEQIIQFYR